MAAPRDLDAIDRELRFVLARRESNRRQISQLSLAIINDTARIDRLLAERSDAREIAEFTKIGTLPA